MLGGVGGHQKCQVRNGSHSRTLSIYSALAPLSPHCIWMAVLAGEEIGSKTNTSDGATNPQLCREVTNSFHIQWGCRRLEPSVV